MADRPLDYAGIDLARHDLPAVPSSIPTIRHQFDRVLEALQFTPERGADIRLALTEACTNAVQHAYPDRSPPGTMIIVFEVSFEALIVTVLDSGCGIDSPSPQSGLGVGLSVIRALVDNVTVGHLKPGTSVRMTFLR